MRPPRSNLNARRNRSGGFTLVELILVMVLLATVMAVVAPSLSKFFKGRKLDNEARRFIALTGYAQSLAIERGSPVLVWINEANSTYGAMEQDASFVAQATRQSDLLRRDGGGKALDPNAPSFQNADSVLFEHTEYSKVDNGFETIRFLPDGSIDDSSLQIIKLIQVDPSQTTASPNALWVSISRDKTKYEIVDENAAYDRAQNTQKIVEGATGRSVYAR